MDYLEEWNAEQRRNAADWRQKNNAVRAALDEIKVRIDSRNGELSIAVDAYAKITDVRLTPQALRLGDVRLGDLLRETIQRAQAEARRQVDIASQPLTSDPSATAATEAIRELLGDT